MANEATAELYTRQSGLNKAKFRTDYEQYLADLATKYGISNEQLNTNLEARGILRSGEAGTARTRLSAAEEAARTSAQTNYDYNIDTEDTNLATKLAGLMAGGSSGGTPPPAAPPPAAPPPADEPAIPPADEPAKPAKPVNWNALAGWAGLPSNDAPAPTPVRTGTADSMERNAPAVRPVRDATPRPAVPVTNMPRPGTTPAAALPDLSGVDWDALARMGTTRPVRDAAPRAPRPVTTAPRPGTGTTTRVNPVSARNR
jgi:hypothetical protein